MVCSHCYYIVNAKIYTGKEPGAPPTRDLASQVGTLKKNKTEILPEFLPQRARSELSSVFGFDGEKILVTFVPKKNKAVVLLSTMHRDAAVDVETSKPDIILFYSESKGGVDTCDQMVKAMTAKRKTNRWPMAIFYRLLDFACLNSFVVCRTVKPDVVALFSRQ